MKKMDENVGCGLALILAAIAFLIFDATPHIIAWIERQP